MHNRHQLAAVLALGIALIAAAGTMAVRAHRASAARAAAALTAEACPVTAKKANFNFSLPDVNGNVVKLSDYAGKVVLLDFWATWCVPCQVEIPGFIGLSEKYKSRGVAVVGLVVMDEFKNAKPYADAHGMTYPILDAVDRPDIEAAFGPLMGLPTSFVIGRDGRICAAHLGVPDVKTPAPTLEQSIQNVFDAEIRALL